MNRKPSYTILSHTADICIRVQGNSVKHLYITTAQAQFHLLAERIARKSDKIQRIEIRLVEESHEDLMVAWLNELLSLSSVKDLVFEEFTIESIDENTLHAFVYGAPREEFRFKTEIKAATYHALRIEEKDGEWQAEVVFDV